VPEVGRAGAARLRGMCPLRGAVAQRCDRAQVQLQVQLSALQCRGVRLANLGGGARRGGGKWRTGARASASKKALVAVPRARDAFRRALSSFSAAHML